MRRALIAIADTLCAVLLPFALSLLVWTRVTPRRSGRGALLHLSAGSSTAEIVEKFGSLDMLFMTIPGTEAFTGNVVFWFRSR